MTSWAIEESARNTGAVGRADRGTCARAIAHAGRIWLRLLAEALLLAFAGPVHLLCAAVPQNDASTAAWQPVGPVAVSTAGYGLVTGRVASIAFDPADSTGNRVYLGTTGGGVWVSANAGISQPSSVAFEPLTDTLGALSGARDASITIGAVSVQPGGTGVVLAGTGDPNDALDSYYGAGILRSTDGGTTWILIQLTADHLWAFSGEAFAGFAWSTQNPQLVVAAVSQAYEGFLANAVRPNVSYEGLYYSTDSGATWSLARITDLNGHDVQGPLDPFVPPDGNAVTSVVWNPVRNLFIAAVRYHGYYQSTDGANWTRLAAQPGTGLTTAACPTRPGRVGSPACPIFRGTLAVNPQTGDTLAWTVDVYNQDQGIWQDTCALNAGTCSNPNVNFAAQWNTSRLESNDPQQGPAAIENGDHTLALAAVPSGQDTLLLAGANDLWRCSLAAGCAWRNTTNALGCNSAQVAPYPHALAWNAANPSEILVGNDSGLWRSEDAIGETGQPCSPDDAAHFQNLNAGLGSLAEVTSLSAASATPTTMMVGLGVNGTAGVQNAPAPTSVWPQILSGTGGPVAIDPTSAANWYVNNAAGVSIHQCAQGDDCTPAAFGAPVITNANVSGDGTSMTKPAPFLVDPLDPTQLLVGTCRVWRGPANGNGWSAGNAISPFLDGTNAAYCNGDPLIRTMAALALPDGSELVYVGMYGAADGGTTLPGHIFVATLRPGSPSKPKWQDLTLNPVAGDTYGMNAFGEDISSIFVDPHDPTGNTVYVTVEGIPQPTTNICTVYRSTDGGSHWQSLLSNLPLAAVNSLVVDPEDANTVYVGTDAGVFSTRQIASCVGVLGSCWSAYGTGLPAAPVTQLNTVSASSSVLVAGTYGRGIWQIPLWTAGGILTTAVANPVSLTFSAQPYGSASSAQTVTLTNTGTAPLQVSSIGASGDFTETDNCQSAVAAGASCDLYLTFTPAGMGTRTGTLTINANVSGGQILVSLTGTGIKANAVLLTPAMLNFGTVEVGAVSSPLQVTVENGTSLAVSVASASVAAPFAVASNACGSTLAPNSDCQLTVTFAPTQAGVATGILSMVDSAGTQSVTLSGTGAAPPTDTLAPLSLNFSGTVVGQNSAAQTVSLTNSGGVPLTGITATASGPFQVANNCTTQLAANATCSLSVQFVPAAVGAQTGTLTVSDLLRTQTVALAGTGLQPPSLDASPASLSFPAQQVGVASAPLSLNIRNAGGAPLANVGFQIAGPSASSFSLGSTTCAGTLNNGSACTAQVLFTPVAAGGNAATLTVASATLGVKAVQVVLSGSGQASSGINVSPAQLTFTVSTLGQASAAQSITVANSASTAAVGVSIAANAPFATAQSTCGPTLASGASCAVALVFTPRTNGVATGALSISSTNLNPATVLLTGIGGAAGAVQLQPSVVNFPTTGIGATSSVQAVTIANAGPVAFTDLALSVSSGFRMVNTTCIPALAVGANCMANLAFAPSSAGQQTGTLTATSSALPSSAQATLSGVAFDFTAIVTGSAHQTVSSGQTATYTLTLAPLSGSTGTFTFACGTLPAHAVCSFNPASQAVAANATGTVTVQVATGDAAGASLASRGANWTNAPFLLSVLVLPIAWRKRRRILLFLALLGLAVSGICSCATAGGGTGGSAYGGQGGAGTAAGTYSIPVSATANGVTHTVTVMLTVD